LPRLAELSRARSVRIGAGSSGAPSTRPDAEALPASLHHRAAEDRIPRWLVEWHLHRSNHRRRLRRHGAEVMAAIRIYRWLRKSGYGFAHSIRRAIKQSRN
jgi:hypothetical protein